VDTIQSSISNSFSVDGKEVFKHKNRHKDLGL